MEYFQFEPSSNMKQERNLITWLQGLNFFIPIFIYSFPCNNNNYYY